MSIKIKWLILGSIVAFLILSGIQYYLIQNTYHYKISAFKKEVTAKASSTLHDIGFDSLAQSIASKTVHSLGLYSYDHKIQKEDLLDSLSLMRSNDTLNYKLVTKFRKEMHEKGVVILLGLSNGTSATQGMDQGYVTFQPECQESTICVVGMKLTARVQVQKDAESKHAMSESPSAPPSVDGLEFSTER